MKNINLKLKEVRLILDTKKDRYGVLNYFEIQWYREYYLQLLKLASKGK